MNIKSQISVFLFAFLIGCSSSDESGSETNLSQPQVQLNNVSNISNNSATISGIVVDQGGADVTARGFVYGTSPNPDLGDSSINLGTGSGNFSGDITNLQSATEYFVRAFATNSNGTSFSGQQSFTTTQQDCDNIVEGFVWLRNQQDVDNFGALGYCEITGYLDIDQYNSSDPIVDLSPLGSIEKVGSLRIIRNPSLQSLDGLNIHTIKNDLEIRQNEALVNIEALSSITSDINRVIVTDNELLPNVDGLSGLTSFVIKESTIPPYENVPPELFIGGNLSMINIDGLQNVQFFEAGEVKIRNNDQLLNINSLSSITFSNVDLLDIYGNDILSDLSGLSNVTTLPGALIIQNNGNSDLLGLSNLTSVGGIFIIDYGSDYQGPVSLSGLENLIEVGGTLSILTNPNQPIYNIDPLQNLVSLGGLFLFSLDLLENLDGLSNLQTVAGNLEIENNLDLTNVNGLSNLTNVEGRLDISDNSLITNLDGLSSLNLVAGNLYIRANDDLNDLCGLTTLILGDGLGGSYYVSSNGYNPTEQDIIDGNCSL